MLRLNPRSRQSLQRELLSCFTGVGIDNLVCLTLSCRIETNCSLATSGASCIDYLASRFNYLLLITLRLMVLLNVPTRLSSSQSDNMSTDDRPIGHCTSHMSKAFSTTRLALPQTWHPMNSFTVLRSASSQVSRHHSTLQSSQLMITSTTSLNELRTLLPLPKTIASQRRLIR